MHYHLNDDQRRLVEENLEVVEKVIWKFIHPNRTIHGLEYEDLYQIGAIGLCKAAATYQYGQNAAFHSYAFGIVRNELYDYLRKALRKNKAYGKFVTDEKKELEQYYRIPFDRDMGEILALMTLVDNSEKYSATVRTGIDAMALKVQGFSSKEIAEKFSMKPNHLSACISRARNYLRKDKHFMKGIIRYSDG